MKFNKLQVKGFIFGLGVIGFGIGVGFLSGVVFMVIT